MAIGPKGPPRKPGPSIRGRAIFSTFRGIPYVRPWPKPAPTKPGTPRDRTAKAFAAANRACKVTASMIYGAHWEATRGTPLLPRDLMIAMMYGRAFALQLPDGRIIRSMAAANDVSKSLDMLSHEEGAFLVRGPTRWEASERPPGQPKAMLVFNTTRTGQNWNPSHIPSWDEALYDIGGWTDLTSDATRLTVPEGIHWVRVSTMLEMSAMGANWLQGWVLKNGSPDFYGFIRQRDPSGSAIKFVPMSTAPIPVVPGDYFQIEVSPGGDTSTTIDQYWNYFAIEAL